MTFEEEFESIKAAARDWAQRDTRRQLTLARAMIGTYAELRHLEKDYVEEQEGDHYR